MSRTRSWFFASLVVPSFAVACSGTSNTTPPGDGGADSTTGGGMTEAGDDGSADVVASDASDASDASLDTAADVGADTASDSSVRQDAGADAADAHDGAFEAEAGPPAPVVVVSDAPSATQLLTDGTDLFWIDSIAAEAGTLGRVMKVPVGGGTEVTLASTPGVIPERLALDGAQVYFTDAANNVWSVPKAGGTPTALVTSDEYSPLTAAGGTVYYGLTGGVAKITSVPDAGADAATSVVLSTSGGPADLIALAGNLYWAAPGAGLIQYVPQSGGGAPSTLLAPDPDAGSGEFVSSTSRQNLVAAGTTLYWNRAPSAGIPGAIMSIPITGGAPSVVINLGTDQPFSVVTDGNSVFYLDLGATTSLVTVGVGGGAPVSLTTSSLNAANIVGAPGPTVAVDSSRVYWLNPPQILSLAK